MLKLKEKLKQITDRRAPGGIERVKRELKLTLRGWVNYFYKAIPAKWVERTDQWLHRRVRQIYWKQWKRPAKRREEFKSGGRTLRRYMNMLTALTGIGECQRECRFIWL